MKRGKKTSYLFFLILICGVQINNNAYSMPIEQAIRKAIDTHPAVISQIEIRNAAKIDIRTAQQHFFPTPSFVLEKINSDGRSDLTYGAESTSQTYRLQQPIWTGGRLSAGVEKAAASFRVAEVNIVEAKQKVALQVIQSWSDWYSSYLRINLQRQSLATIERLMSLLRRRISEGASAASELSLTKSRLDQAVSQIKAYESQHFVARKRLSLLIGQNIEENEVPKVVADYKISHFENILTRSRESSPVLNRINLQKEIINQEVREKQADKYPDIYMRIEHQRSSINGGSVGNNRIYFGLSSRFGAGLSNITMIESMEKRRHSLDAEYESADRALTDAVETDLALLNSIRIRMVYLQGAMLAAQQTSEAWNRQFLAGRRSWVELMNSVREAVQAETEWIDANVLMLAAAWRLKIYSGDVIDFHEGMMEEIN